MRVACKHFVFDIASIYLKACLGCIHFDLGKPPLQNDVRKMLRWRALHRKVESGRI